MGPEWNLRYEFISCIIAIVHLRRASMYTIQSQILKQRRLTLGYTKSDVAKYIGTSPQQYSKYESGLINIDKGREPIIHLMRLYQLNMEEMFQIINEPDM